MERFGPSAIRVAAAAEAIAFLTSRAWYRDGNHSLACSIKQNKKNLTFTNESGQTARGSFLGPKHVTANWGGQTINGALVNNAGRINWDNGTSWSR